MFKSETMGLIAVLIGAAAVMGFALLFVWSQESDGLDNDIHIEAPVEAEK